MTRIAVAGATGRVGRHIVDVLEADGHEVVPIARSRGVDVITGEGLAAALAGAEVIVDAATSPSPDEKTATEFFATATRNLQEVGAAAGVRRVVAISIIGIDKFEGGYNAAKLVQEAAHQAGPIPARMLRASQFHEFVEQLMDWGRQGDVSYLPNMRTQLVAARTVAEKAAELAVSDGGGPEILEIAGPREENLAAMAALVAERRGDGVRVESRSDPSDPVTALWESGALLPGPGATLAGPTFEEWLNAKVSSASQRGLESTASR
jgi:uncharacterized protein YbjT (DUF2867 family)